MNNKNNSAQELLNIDLDAVVQNSASSRKGKRVIDAVVITLLLLMTVFYTYMFYVDVRGYEHYQAFRILFILSCIISAIIIVISWTSIYKKNLILYQTIATFFLVLVCFAYTLSGTALFYYHYYYYINFGKFIMRLLNFNRDGLYTQLITSVSVLLLTAKYNVIKRK